MVIILKIIGLIFLIVNPLEGLEDVSQIDLDTYLKINNVFVSEGYVTETQKNELIQDIQKAHEINKILEIGFNAGHSSEFFLKNTACTKLVSFDIGLHEYLHYGVEFIRHKYGEKFSLILGDSKITVPEYAAAHSSEKFDLIFIDGGHSYDCFLADLQNCRQLAKESTLVIIDDYVGDVQTVVDEWVRSGQLTILDYKVADEIYIPGLNGGGRRWILAKYTDRSLRDRSY